MPQSILRPPATYFIRDPDLILSHSDFESINYDLKKIEKIQVGVLIIEKISHIYMNHYSDGDTAAHHFAKEIFDYWGIGDPRTNNGLLIFISVRDRKFRIVTGRGAMEYVSDGNADSIFEDVKPYLKKGNYADGIRKALQGVEYYLNPESSASKISDFFITLLIILMLPMVFCCTFICIVTICSHPTNSTKRADFTSNIEKLKKLQREGQLNEQFINSACGICLIEFERSDNENPQAANYVILVCGHNFHKDCIECWLKKKNICPFCKRIDPANPNRDNIDNQANDLNQINESDRLNQPNNYVNYSNNNNNIMERMLFIQRNRFSEFYDDYAFDYVGNSFTYRDIRPARDYSIPVRDNNNSGWDNAFSSFAGGIADGGGGGGSW